MRVYLIHFEIPYKHARHYIGFTHYKDDRRLQHHRNGNGSKLLKIVSNEGIEYQEVRSWSDKDRNFERYLKDIYKHTKRLCPICNPKSWNNCPKKKK